MATIIPFPRHHARASSSLRAAKAAKTSRVISGQPRSAAKATSEAQCAAGMPLDFQPLTVESDCPSCSASSPRAPGAGPASFAMSESQLSMDRTIVRALRTCQGFANRETTLRSLRAPMGSMNTDHDIARRLVAVREHFKRKQIDFAADLNIAKNTLNGYESGERPLSLETAKRIRDRFGVSTDWLLYGDVGQPSHDLVIQLGPKPLIKEDRKKPKKVVRRREAS